MTGSFLRRRILKSVFRTEARNGSHAFLAHPEVAAGRKIVVCIGDSITRGQVSCNYVDRLVAMLGERFCFINAGINSDQSLNVLERLEAVDACRPDYATLLIGTNDAFRMLDSRHARRAPGRSAPSGVEASARFRENLSAIVLHLKARTSAKIALLSIPPIGEDLDAPAMSVARQFSDLARATAEEHGAAYLPLLEEMTLVLQRERSRPLSRGYTRAAVVRNFIAGRLIGVDLDKIAERYRFVLHTDPLHLNCRGADMVARLIASVL